MQLDAYLRYVQFDDADGARLRAFWPTVAPHVDALCATFYERVLSESTTAAILESPDVVRRLMRSLGVWLHETLNGPWDAEYASRRQRIGHVHVAVGVPHGAMFSAMTVVQAELVALASALPTDVRCDTVTSVLRVMSLDLSLMTSTFHELRQARAVRDMQTLVVAHIPAIAMLVDPSGVVRAVTPAAARYFEREDPIGASLAELLPAELLEAARLAESLREARRTGRAILQPRVEWVQQQQERYLALHVIPLEESDGLCMIHLEDHTMAVENEALIQRQESLVQLGALSATIAHELRNPLAGISGALQVMANGLKDDDRYGRIMGKVLEQVRSLNSLVTDLLAFARPRDAVLQPGTMVRPLVQNVVDTLADDWPYVTFSVVGDARVTIDPDMFQQIQLNLAINACQAMDGRGEVRWEIDHDRVLVADSGPGISEAALVRLFEPFFTTKTKGTGLGLATSMKFARMMGCQLMYRRDLSPGAWFELRLS